MTTHLHFRELATIATVNDDGISASVSISSASAATAAVHTSARYVYTLYYIIVCVVWWVGGWVGASPPITVD